MPTSPDDDVEVPWYELARMKAKCKPSGTGVMLRARSATAGRESHKQRFIRSILVAMQCTAASISLISSLCGSEC